MNNPCIETGIDRLHTLVEEREELTLTEAAEQLRVPRRIVEHWSETLEDANMIVCTFSLNEKSLMTKKHHCKKKGTVENMKRQLRLFVSNGKCPEEKELFAREKEIRKQSKLIQKKIKELEKYKTARSKVEALIKQAAKEHKGLAAVKKEIEKEKVANLIMRKALENKTLEHQVALDALKRRETGMTDRIATLRERERFIAKREAELATKEKQIENSISRIINAATE